MLETVFAAIEQLAATGERLLIDAGLEREYPASLVRRGPLAPVVDPFERHARGAGHQESASQRRALERVIGAILAGPRVVDDARVLALDPARAALPVDRQSQRPSEHVRQPRAAAERRDTILVGDEEVGWREQIALAAEVLAGRVLEDRSIFVVLVLDSIDGVDGVAQALVLEARHVPVEHADDARRAEHLSQLDRLAEEPIVTQ